MKSPPPLVTIGAVSGALALTAVLLIQSMEEKRDEKLSQSWLEFVDWTTDYDQALERSRKSGKPIFAYFTRSYAY